MGVKAKLRLGKDRNAELGYTEAVLLGKDRKAEEQTGQKAQAKLRQSRRQQSRHCQAG
jgi:hypothetical protein